MVKIKDLKKGERVSMTDYFIVDKVEKDSVVVIDSLGASITFHGIDLVESKFISNSQYTETIRCGKHEMVEKMNNARDRIFTVCFNKKDGSERILTGHLRSIEPNLGRTNVIDLEVGGDPKKGHRQVDNRSINWLVLDNVRYVAQ